MLHSDMNNFKIGFTAQLNAEAEVILATRFLVAGDSDFRVQRRRPVKRVDPIAPALGGGVPDVQWHWL